MAVQVKTSTSDVYYLSLILVSAFRGSFRRFITFVDSVLFYSCIKISSNSFQTLKTRLHFSKSIKLNKPAGLANFSNRRFTLNKRPQMSQKDCSKRIKLDLNVQNLTIRSVVQNWKEKQFLKNIKMFLRPVCRNHHYGMPEGTNYLNFN